MDSDVKRGFGEKHAWTQRLGHGSRGGAGREQQTSRDRCSPRHGGARWFLPAFPWLIPLLCRLCWASHGMSMPVWQFTGNQYWIFCIKPEVEGKGKGEGRQAADC